MSTDRRRSSVASKSFFKAGDVFDKYDIGEVLGVWAFASHFENFWKYSSGNYAEVKLGIDKFTKEKVAIKVLPVQQETTQDILNEIDILARVGSSFQHVFIIFLRLTTIPTSFNSEKFMRTMEWCTLWQS